MRNYLKSLDLTHFWTLCAALFIFNASQHKRSTTTLHPHIQPVEIESKSASKRLLLGEKLDLNRVDIFDLLALPGIGPKMARRVLRDRELRGSYENVADLQRVKGLGPKSVAKIRPWVQIQGPGIEKKRQSR